MTYQLGLILILVVFALIIAKRFNKKESEDGYLFI